MKDKNLELRIKNLEGQIGPKVEGDDGFDRPVLAAMILERCRLAAELKQRQELKLAA